MNTIAILVTELLSDVQSCSLVAAAHRVHLLALQLFGGCIFWLLFLCCCVAATANVTYFCQCCL
jgi:hypothetical protein